MAEVTDKDRERLREAVEFLRHDKNGICYLTPCQKCVALMDKFAAVREQALESKIGPDWREALPYETEIELAAEIARLRADIRLASVGREAMTIKALREQVRALREGYAKIRDLKSRTSHYAHYDPKGTAGANCDACHASGEITEVIIAALAASAEDKTK